MHRVVNEQHVGKLTVANDSEVFDVVSIMRLHTVLAIEPELDELVGRVNQVYHLVSVVLGRSCENADLEASAAGF